MNKSPIFLIDSATQNSATTNAAMADRFEQSVLLLHSSRNKEVPSYFRVDSGFEHFCL
jgi:hypothetical protein